MTGSHAAASIPFPNTARAWERLETLAGFTRPDVPWTRRAFTPLFEQARDYLRHEFEAAGLQVRQDAAGNLIGRREGAIPGLAPIISGSHTDTVVGGGRYDGILGVVAALEMAQTLDETGVRLRHPFEVIDFLSEEPSDYGVSCIGSRAMSGVLTPQLLACSNEAGETLAQGMARMGYAPQLLDRALRGPASTAAFVELHIEQGPVLESRALPIGVVTSIVGIRRVLLQVHGQPDHAGTTPMSIRRDALVGAARIIDRAHAAASQMSGDPDYVVATVGRLRMTPNVPNAVPGFVELLLEVRSDNQAVLDDFPESLLRALAADLQALRLRCELSEVSRASPTDCDPWVIELIEKAAGALGYSSLRMPSGAGHDAVYMAPTGPMGMIFIPCLAGRSHCPEESIDQTQLRDGLQVLYRTIMELDTGLDR